MNKMIASLALSLTVLLTGCFESEADKKQAELEKKQTELEKKREILTKPYTKPIPRASAAAPMKIESSQKARTSNQSALLPVPKTTD